MAHLYGETKPARRRGTQATVYAGPPRVVPLPGRAAAAATATTSSPQTSERIAPGLVRWLPLAVPLLAAFMCSMIVLIWSAVL